MARFAHGGTTAPSGSLSLQVTRGGVRRIPAPLPATTEQEAFVAPDAAELPDYNSWSIDDLKAEVARLAVVRTANRLQQNAAQAALDAAVALSGLSPEQIAAFAARAAAKE